jgi:hypothetical protein
MRMVVGARGRVADADETKQFDRPPPRRRAGQAHVAPQRVVDLRADGHDRIEGRHRVLEHHRDSTAANVLHAPFGQAQQVLAAEADLAAP